MYFRDCLVLNNGLSYGNLTEFNKTKVWIVENLCASIYVCVPLNNKADRKSNSKMEDYEMGIEKENFIMMVFEFVIVVPCKHFNNNNGFHVIFAMVFRTRNQCSLIITKE